MEVIYKFSYGLYVFVDLIYFIIIYKFYLFHELRGKPQILTITLKCISSGSFKYRTRLLSIHSKTKGTYLDMYMHVYTIHCDVKQMKILQQYIIILVTLGSNTPKGP